MGIFLRKKELNTVLLCLEIKTPAKPFSLKGLEMEFEEEPFLKRFFLKKKTPYSISLKYTFVILVAASVYVPPLLW